MTTPLIFPNLDPILFSIGSFAIRWYSLAYIFGFIIGLWGAKKMLATPLLWRDNKPPFKPEVMDDALLWIAFGGILGGRLFYVFVYNFSLFIENPLNLFKVWEGGMAFHGGIIGSLLGIYFFARKNKVSLLSLLDLTASVTPLGILFGRLANFINGELFGRVTDFKYGMIFPHGGDLPRHMSQLYQAFMEGLVLLIIVQLLAWRGAFKHHGLVTGVFASLYGIFRFIGEFFREPDSQLGFLWGGATMGQLLSLPLIFIGLAFIYKAKSRGY